MYCNGKMEVISAWNACVQSVEVGKCLFLSC
jgi:hypothetical protein